MGIPVTISVDDYLLFNAGQNMTGDWNPIMGREGADGALWGPILEKAVAKL